MRGANAITMMGQRRPDDDARRKAMVRLNGMMFYCTGIASFVESTPPLDTNRLIKLSECEADVRPWLERVWLPGRAEHGRAFREYIESIWPEFEWDAAFEEFCLVYGSSSPARVGAPGLALEFVARCVTETTLAVFYRTLSRCADEPRLRELAERAARDHGAYFNYFRGLVDRVAGTKRAWLTTLCRTALSTCRAARGVDVAAAFSPLGRHWHGGWVFPELSYPEFLARLARLIRRHGGLGPVERLLFHPWLNPPDTIAQPAPPQAAGRARKAPGPASLAATR